uniref:Uncharacterized protein n=1 Tax=Tanacetum cinerariifolium TaxID=118510 RepID=A0A699TTG8_TANCI|nr:hypothetical protein [Tanacetum cinerariifolium]
MFVATKKQAQEIVQTEAQRLKMPFLIMNVIGKAIEDGLSERKVDKEDADRKEADEAAIAEKTEADTEA